MKLGYDGDINTEALIKSFMYRILLLFIALAAVRTHKRTNTHTHILILCARSLSPTLMCIVFYSPVWFCFVFIIIIVFNWNIFTQFNSEMILLRWICFIVWIHRINICCVCVHLWKSIRRMLFQYCVFVYQCVQCTFFHNLFAFLIYYK